MDQEIKALQEMFASLDSLDEDARKRVLGYVLQKYGNGQPVYPSPDNGFLKDEKPAQDGLPPLHKGIDIRTLKEEKKPRTAIEMAVLVGYYLSEIGDADGKRGTFGSGDLTKYFKMAAFPLAKGGTGAATLRNAKNAGYLDPAKHGLYRINPVGYNLVVHKMGKKQD